MSDTPPADAKYLEARLDAIERLADERGRFLETLIQNGEQRLTQMAAERAGRMDQRYEAQQTALVTAQQTSQRALDEAKALVQAGFEKNNEWRGSINDVISTRVARDQYDSAHTSLIEKVDLGFRGLETRLTTIESRLALYEGRTSGSNDRKSESRATLGVTVAITGLCAGLVSMIVGGVLFVALHVASPPLYAAAPPAPIMAQPK
jgi:hypothetical protein